MNLLKNKKRNSQSFLDKIGAWRFVSTEMKMSASNTNVGIYPDIPGVICVDTRLELIKVQKLEKSSLNEYLKANNLPLKIEVSF